jgi:hypothetical protein
VSRRFEVSLSAQGYNRFVFDYENTHDMMGPIRLAGAHFTRGGIKYYNCTSLHWFQCSRYFSALYK